MRKRRFIALLLALGFVFCIDVGGLNTASAEEPTTITVGSTFEFYKSPVPWTESDVWKIIQEQANVKIDYTYYDKDKFNLLLASMDLPDLMFGSYSDKLDEIADNGLAMDLGPLLEKYIPNRSQKYFDQFDKLVRLAYGGKSNALYFFSTSIGLENARGDSDSGRGCNIRWDYYKDIGAPEITDDDAYIKILEQMVAAHPETANGKKTYATGLYDDFGHWYLRASFMKPALMNYWTFSGTQYMQGYDDGVLHNGYTNTERSAFWQDMAFYRKLYQKGLLDPDSFTQTMDEWDAKVRTGCYMATMGFRENSLYTEMKKEDPNTISGLIRVPSANALVFANKHLVMGNFPDEYLFISSKSKNWEAVCRLLNVLCDPATSRMQWSGIEGQWWNYVNGVPTLTDDALRIWSEGGDEVDKVGAGPDCPFQLVLADIANPDGYGTGLFDTDEMRAASLNPLQKDFSNYYKVSYPSEASTRLVDKGLTVDLSSTYSQLISTFVEDMPSDITRIVAKSNDVLYKAIPSLVMAKSDDDYAAAQAQVLKDLQAVGENTAWDWCRNAWGSAETEVTPIIKSIDW